MKNRKRGFTLIELLVVVLIIGILAAVALPQYQKAVDKARVAKYLAFGRSAVKAMDMYYLANNTLPYNWGDLDLDFNAGYFCSPAFTTPAVNGGSNCTNALWAKDHYWSLATDGRVQLLVSFTGKTPLNDGSNADIYMFFIAESIAGNASLPDNVRKRAGKIQCSGQTDYGKQLCSSLGKKDSTLATSDNVFFL